MIRKGIGNRELRAGIVVRNRYITRHIFFVVSFLFISTAFSFAQSGSDGLYWEAPAVFSARQGTFPVSAYTENFSAVAWQEAQSGSGGNNINIYMAIKDNGGNWQQRGLVSGPYPYSGTEPSILSMVIDNNGRIIIAAAAASTQIDILISENKGVSFTRQSINMGAENSVAPRIFVRADGGYLLFVTRGRNESLSIYYSRSTDAVTWTNFDLFATENNLTLNFLPTHAGLGKRDIVFFQSLARTGTDSSPFFQLYYKTSDDGGRSWSTARRFTNFTDPIMYTTAPANSFDNQRPHLTKYGNSLFLVWERRYTNYAPNVYGAIISSSGSISGSVERLNTEEAYCSNPIGFVYNDKPVAVWFDNRRGNNRVVLAQQGAIDWRNHILSNGDSESSFARPIVSVDGAFIFWQSTSSSRNEARNTSRLYMISPDRTASPPRITAINFTPSRASRMERPRLSWNIPADTSGIQGFSWTWSQDEETVPSTDVSIYNSGSTQNLNLELNADNDGIWYFKIAALDWAGNWSEPAVVSYIRKTTPPPHVVIDFPDTDANGFITSNNFNLTWQPPQDPYIAGYTWNLQFLGNDENTPVSNPPSSIMGSDNFIRFQNQENGAWGFSVAAIDQAGNIGPASSITFRANKFVPYTDVSYIDAQQNEQGIITISVIGRGFTTNGIVNSIVLACEGRPDTVAGSFNVLSDREISISLEHLDEGEYYLKINHPARGWYNTDPFISVARTGTVKIGDYSRQWSPSWTVQRHTITFNPVIVLTVILLFFCLLGAVAAIRGIGGVIAEGEAVRLEALAIITGDFMPMEKKQKLVKIKRRGSGLRLKLASFTIALVILVVVMISTPMYLIMTNMQRETLLQGLWDRSRVLLEGLATSSKAYMPQGEAGLLELSFLPAQSSALPEANYVTITGFAAGSIHTDHILATNDPNIDSKIDTQEYRRGISRITDNLTPHYEQFSTELNDLAKEAVGDLARSIAELNREGMAYVLRTDTEGRNRLADIQTTVRTLDVKLTETLSEIAGEMWAFPEFTMENIEKKGERTFIFYKPVMYRQGTEDNYFRGLIRLEVSLNTIMDAIFHGQIVLLRTIIIVALIGILIGFTFAIILSNLIVLPIRKLVEHIEIIRDTEDKSKLAGVEIEIKTKDEIAILGNTINDMTHGLVKAALAASDLSIGKEIQKKFIPLEVDSQGNKQTSGFKKTKNLNFFGYYEGAKGVSGDYFDYKELDDRYYAIIKCDVAGKGIPAALIMIQVATMFLNHFKQWKPDAKGMKLEEIVYQINDFIEALAFKGRFAAFTLCVFDSATGVVRFCNAGDNIVHYYDASEGKLKTISLPQTPATGVLPNFMIENTGGYSVRTVQIDKGDILLLYTDGIEEAKRKFRNKDFKEIVCEEGPVDTPHENHLCGQADEEMSPERVEAIINAVMAKEKYTLKKYHNPEGEIELQFDFSTCESNEEEVIMAMVSVEKMFRVYKDPSAGEESRVLVDKKVDEFLKKHFLQYRRYCSRTREYPENPAYMYYTHIKEDEQYDDLTILGIKRK